MICGGKVLNNKASETLLTICNIKDTSKIDHVDITPCSKEPCEIKKGEFSDVTIYIIPGSDSETAKLDTTIRRLPPGPI
jgi:hypothetical protein